MTNSNIEKINALIVCPGIEQCQKDLCVCYYHEDDAEYCAARDILNMVSTIVLSKTTPAVSDAERRVRQRPPRDRKEKGNRNSIARNRKTLY